MGVITNRVPASMPTRRVFANIVGRFILEGLWRGAVYGMVYGLLYGCCLDGGLGGFVGPFYGFGLGVTAGALLGLVDGIVLGAFTLLWGPELAGRYAADSRAYRRGFIGIAVGMTLIGSLLIIPPLTLLVVGNLAPLPGHLLFLGIVPSLIAAFASYQAGHKIAARSQAHVVFLDGLFEKLGSPLE